MLRKLGSTLTTLFLLLGGCAAQKFASTEGIQSAILEGQHTKGRFQGLELQDTGVSFGQALAGSMAGARLPTGYRVVVYSPLEWIKQLASNAAREYRPFSVTTLNASMVENVVRIRVYPSMPTYVTSGGAMLASSVDHVVIKDALRQRVLQPLRTEKFLESAQNAMGASLSYSGVDAIFDLKEVEALRDQNEEFYITIVGRLGERNIKVKRRGLSRLSFAHINTNELHLAPDVTAASTRPATASALAMQKAMSQVSAALSQSTAANGSMPPDGLIIAADTLLQSLRKVDAAFKVSASADLVTSALMDVQMRLDEIQHRSDKGRLQKTIESAAFALQGFLDARASNSDRFLHSAREALESAANSLDNYKSTGGEEQKVKGPAIAESAEAPTGATPETSQKVK